MNLLKIVRKPFRYVFFNATFFVIGFNLLVFLLTNMMRELGNYLALNVILVHEYKMYWQFFTYMFVHGDFSHLFFNMLGLFFFGLAVEQSLGSTKHFFLPLLSFSLSHSPSLSLLLSPSLFLPPTPHQFSN